MKKEEEIEQDKSVLIKKRHYQSEKSNRSEAQSTNLIKNAP